MNRKTRSAIPPDSAGPRRGPFLASGLHRLFPTVLPGLLALLLYLRSGWNGFSSDDEIDILDSRFVTGPFDPIRILTTEYFGGWGHLASGHYRPLLNLTYALVAKIFGVRPAAYHLLNAFLFAVIVAFGVAVLRRLTGEGRVAFLSGLLFAVHPLAVESVASAVGLKELGAACLGLIALSLFVRWRERDGFAGPPRDWGAGAGIFLALLAGLLYKETALAFLPILIAAEFLHVRAPRPANGRQFFSRGLAVLPAVAAAVVALSLRVAVTGGIFHPTAIFSVDNPLVRLHGTDRLMAAFSLLARYLELFFWPACLSSDYSDGSIPLSLSVTDPWLLASVFVSLALAAILVGALAWGARTVAFGAVIFSASYAITSNVLILIGTNMAERLFFIPCWGLCILAAAALSSFWTRWRVPAAVLTAILVLALAARSWSRIGDWKSTETLTASSLACYPGNIKAIVQSANEDFRKGGLDAGVARYLKVSRDTPAFFYINAQLGLAYAAYGRLDLAEKPLAINADSPEALPVAVVELARLYLATNRPEEAFRTATRALDTDMQYSLAASARTILGNVLRDRGDIAGAEMEYRLALAEDPLSARAHYNLGSCLESRKELEAALGEYKRAEALDPDDPTILRSRSLAESALGRHEEALITAGRLRSKHPDFLPGRIQWMTAQFLLDHLDQAREEAEAILQRDAAERNAHLVLAALAQKAADKAAARKHYEAVLSQPDLPGDVADDVRRRIEGLDH